MKLMSLIFAAALIVASCSNSNDPEDDQPVTTDSRSFTVNGGLYENDVLKGFSDDITALAQVGQVVMAIGFAGPDNETSNTGFRIAMQVEPRWKNAVFWLTRAACCIECVTITTE